MSSASPEEKFFRPAMAKFTPNWDEGSSTIPRSPLAFDQLAQGSQRQRGASSFGLEPIGRASKGPTLSSLPTTRSFSGRQATERGVSLSVGQHRSPYPSSSRFFVTVVPPIDLPHDPPHPRSHASTSSSTHVQRGTLLPLYPTLGGQLYAISREYGLPSIGGLAIYLCDDGEGNLGPRVGDAAWSALWSRFFDENADDLYQDITSPTPPQRISHNHERDTSRASSDFRSPYGESNALRRESDTYEEGFSHEERRPSSSTRRPFVNGYPASPMAYNTPSPRVAKSGRSQSRSSLHTPASVQARLPIVGRIEWNVDKKRAPWWSNWIGEAEMSSDRSVGSVMNSQELSGNKKRLGRRSMHLASSLSRHQTESPMQSAPLIAKTVVPQSQSKTEVMQTGRARETELGETGLDNTLSGSEDQNEATSSVVESRFEMDNMGYEPIEDNEETHEIASEVEGGLLMTNVNSNLGVEGRKTMAGSDDQSAANYENQSYAGYSALLGVDDEAKTRDESSTRAGGEERSPQRASMQMSVSSSQGKAMDFVHAQPMKHRFNVNALSEDDDGTWRELHVQQAADYDDDSPLHGGLSAQILSTQHVQQATPTMIGATSAVHEWISKTQSPQTGRATLNYGEEEEEEGVEDLLPPQDDVSDVIGLWAEKAREGGSVEEYPSRPTSLAKSVGTIEEQSHDDQGIRQRESVVPQMMSTPLLSHSPLEGDGTVRASELSEEHLQPKDRLAINKASLLSPIALDTSPSAFAGPSADLTSLLGGRTSLAAPTTEQSSRSFSQDSKRGDVQSMLESGPSPRPIYLNMSKTPHHSDSLNSLSSPRLELPSPHSPGGNSHRSSSTDASDTLLDMERALALLSPAVSNQNHNSPAMGGSSTGDTTYESGILTSAIRTRAPFVSSRDSMAKAKTLSTSVTPSPRWFRNTTAALPHLPVSASANINPSFRNLSGVTSIDSQDGEESVKISPRPASAHADSRQRDRLAPWDLQPPPSSTRLVESLVDREPDPREEEDENLNRGEVDATPMAAFTTDSAITTPVITSPEVEADHKGKRESKISTAPSEYSSKEVIDVGANQHTKPTEDLEGEIEDGNDDYLYSRQEEEAPFQREQKHDSVQIYDSPIEDDGSSHDHWLHPDEHLGRQGWSQTTGDNSQMEGALKETSQSQEENHVQHGNSADDGQEELLITARPFTPGQVPSTFSPRSGQYATVGVQAERDDHSRTDSVFSLVSDDAPSSEYSQSNQGNEEEEVDEETEEDENQNGQQIHDTVQRDTLTTPVAEANETPLTASVPRMGRSAESSDEVQPSIQRMIRGFSFAESSEASSSTAASPYLSQNNNVDEQEPHQYDWSKLEIGSSQPVRASQFLEEDEQAQSSIESQQPLLLRRQSPPESVSVDDAITTKGAATEVTSSRSDRDEDWSQDGSEYDDEEEEEEGTGSPSTRRSRMSAYSTQMGGAGLSDAGGRTPTFLYDHHLADDDSPSQQGSRRMSGNNNSRRGSKNRISQRLSRRSLRASDAHLQDVLGVGLYPSHQASLSSEGNGPDESVGHMSIDAMSLAGEMLNSNDDRMLNGFEQVAAHNEDSIHSEQVEQNNDEPSRRESGVSTTSSNNSEKLKLLSEFTARANKRELPTPVVTTTTKTTTTSEGMSPSIAQGQMVTSSSTGNIGASIRRSMGSITENRRDSTGKGRRASASASNFNKTVIISSPSPRRVTPRMAADGSAIIPARISVSPSPKQRFRALPPSPSFLPMSPSSPHFSGMNNITGLMPSPTTSNFPIRQYSAPPTNNIDGLTSLDGNTSGESVTVASPIFRGQSGSTPSSPRGPRPIQVPNLSEYA